MVLGSYCNILSDESTGRGAQYVNNLLEAQEKFRETFNDRNIIDCFFPTTTIFKSYNDEVFYTKPRYYTRNQEILILFNPVNNNPLDKKEIKYKKAYLETLIPGIDEGGEKTESMTVLIKLNGNYLDPNDTEAVMVTFYEKWTDSRWYVRQSRFHESKIIKDELSSQSRTANEGATLGGKKRRKRTYRKKASKKRKTSRRR